MPVVDFIPGLRCLAAAAPGADLQHGRREGKEKERRKEGEMKFHFQPIYVVNPQSSRCTTDPLFLQVIPLMRGMQNLNQTFRAVSSIASQLWTVDGELSKCQQRA